VDWKRIGRGHSNQRAINYLLFKHNKKMRTRNFLVPQELIEDFATAIEENEFDNSIVGTTPDGEIEISIDYDSDQRKVIN
jgi:hypothetical protein